MTPTALPDAAVAATTATTAAARPATLCYDLVPSPIGDLLLVGDGTALTGLYLPGQRDRPDPAAMAAAGWAGAPAPFAAAAEQLGAYFAGERTAFELPLAPPGTAFQRAVWGHLVTVPYGAVTTYAAIAAALGRPRAVRAVGAANGRNPIPIVIPCHRVVGSDGSLTGYGGGVDRKRELLDLEAGCRPLSWSGARG
ncbi:MAG TPA: methylated-DNA--[protein]-cysteine S-methyltransferase [Acidimicrobiales bacterium]